MKTLYLLRHAKSSWDNLGLDDIDRPLNERGKRDAPFMGQKLKEIGVLPALIIASPAKRAKKTAKKIAVQMGYDEAKIVLKRNIYEASLSDLLELLRKQKVDSLMLVGHNPELTALYNFLCPIFIPNIPTAGVVGINFPIASWQEIHHHQGEQLFFEYPKRYFGE
jgi:phosphohistidine phosphatase